MQAMLDAWLDPIDVWLHMICMGCCECVRIPSSMPWLHRFTVLKLFMGHVFCVVRGFCIASMIHVVTRFGEVAT